MGADSFMKLQVYRSDWYLVETQDCGTCIVEASCCGNLNMAYGQTITEEDDTWKKVVSALKDYCEGRVILSVEMVERWGARYSAPGYMDCTDWCLGGSKQEAVKECKEMYGDTEPREEEEELFECQNCGDLWTEKELNEVQDVLQRVDPGEKMPYGECPDCGAVCHKWEK